MLPRALGLLALLAAGAPLVRREPVLPAPGARAPTQVLVTYTLEESLQAVTPAGERSIALAGPVSVAGERVRWELRGSTFPRARASVVLVDGAAMTLLDPRQKESASLPASELETLFRGSAAGDTGGTGAGVRIVEKTIALTRDGLGAPFLGRPTARYRVTLNVLRSVTTPGRVASVHDVARAVVETAADLADAASPLDDLTRLFRPAADVREELAARLAEMEGFPVSASIEGEAEMTAEPIGAAGAGASHERPVHTTTRASRLVSSLTRRPLHARDAALFVAPEGFRSRGPERLVRQDPALP